MIALLQVLSIVSIALGGIEFSAGGINLNPERLMVLAIIPGLIIYVFSNRVIQFPLPARIYATWLAVVLLSFSLSENVYGHINGLIITSVPFVFFLLFLQDDMSGRRMAILSEVFLWIMATASIVVFVVWSYASAFPVFIDRGRIMLTTPEPNILGAYLAIFMVIHMSFANISARTVLLQVISLTALILTASKGPYVFYFVAMLFVLLKKRILTRIGPIVAMVLGLLVVSSVGILLADRIADVYQAVLDRPDAINNRMRLIEVAWDRVGTRPLLGHGPLDFSLSSPDLLSRMGTTNVQNLWIWQIWVALLHDQGAIGLFVFVCLIIFTWRRCTKLARQGSAIHVGYLAAIIVLVGVSQTTTLHLSAIFGMVFGLANAKVRQSVAVLDGVGSITSRSPS